MSEQRRPQVGQTRIRVRSPMPQEYQRPDPQRLARELDGDAHRLEVHAAKMDLLRFKASYEHLDELAKFWVAVNGVIEYLAAVEGRP